MNRDDEPNALVLDIGSYWVRGGFSGDDAPRVLVPPVVGTPKENKPIDRQRGEKDHYIGDEAQIRREMLTIKHPIEKGIITNWEQMEKIWYHTFYVEMASTPEDHPILFSEVPLTPKSCREKTTEILFESFLAPAFYIANQATLGMYARGATDGVVLDSGFQVTHAVPVYQGFAIPHATQRLEFGGSDLTVFMNNILSQSGHSLSHDEAQKIKEKLAYVSTDFEQEMRTGSQSASPNSYELPDGQVIVLGNERFRVPEALFQPSLLGVQPPKGIHEATRDAIMQCDASIHNELLGNVVLAGGNMKFASIEERFSKELENLLPSMSKKVRVTMPGDPRFSTWLGGSILASLQTFADIWISKDEYNECGTSIVNIKCH